MVAKKRSTSIDGEISRYKNSDYPENNEQRAAAEFLKSSEGQKFPKWALVATAFLGNLDLLTVNCTYQAGWVTGSTIVM